MKVRCKMYIKVGNQIVRHLHKRVHGLEFRDALYTDKQAIISLRHNVYRGLDYLPDYFDFFMDDPNRKCIVGVLGQSVIAFGVLMTLDGGQSILGQAGRVHEQYEGRGVFGELSRYINDLGHNNGCTRRMALVETTLNKYARSEKFRQTHTSIASKLHYAGVVTNKVRQDLSAHMKTSRNHTETISIIKTKELKTLIENDEMKNYLFPRDIILLDYLPFRAIIDNLPALPGRSTRFYANLSQTGNDVTGLLSAGTTYKCSNPPESYTIDLFGIKYDDLELHLLYHLKRALQITNGPFCLQIFVEKGYIAERLCKILIKYNIPKCHWYVDGGVTTKTVVEEQFVKCKM